MRLFTTVLVVLVLLVGVQTSQADVQAGISFSGNILTVSLKSSANVSSKTLTAVNIAIKWSSSYTGASLTNITGSTMASQGRFTDAGFEYELISGNPNSAINWTAGVPVVLFTAEVTGGTGTGDFTISNDQFVIDNGCQFYVETFSPVTEVTNLGTPFYAPTASGVALPVQMSSVAAAVNFRSTELSWSTETETNNYGFEIERREIGNSASVWTKVGFVQGAGTSTARRDYSFTDASLAPGRYAYQVKQVDIDGTFQYSGSLEVEVGVADKVLSLGDNYPNPFNPSTSIEFSVPVDGKVMLKVFNILGQEVATLFDGVAEAGRFHQARFDASSLPTGLYFSRLEYDGKSMMKKMLLTK